MRRFNFSAGPATLPEEVLITASEQLRDWNGCGVGIMEMSHRSPEFDGILHDTLQLLREIMEIPNTYSILFMQGGAAAQNAIIPQNLLPAKKIASYAVTGYWSRRSEQEARQYGEIVCAVSADTIDTSPQGIQKYQIPHPSTWNIPPTSAYLHFCSNETISGVEFSDAPKIANIPLVADMSSNLMTQPLRLDNYGLIYASAQKNLGIAGLTLVIVHNDLLGFAQNITPSVFNYSIQKKEESRYNTPPVHAIYMANLVLKWLKQQGGVATMQLRSHLKSKHLYETIDNSQLYYNPIAPPYRSRINIPFFLREPSLESAFLIGAGEAGLLQLKGHRLLGGIRASLYNAMPLAGVEALTAYMKEFERKA